MTSFKPESNSSPEQESSTASSLSDAIHACHAQAVQQGADTYPDPHTGLLVMTELHHLKRGYCCRSACRHCPYGFVPNSP